MLEVNRHLKQQSDSACHGSPTTMCKSLRPALDNGSPPEGEESIGRPARAAAAAIVLRSDPTPAHTAAASTRTSYLAVALLVPASFLVDKFRLLHVCC